MLLLVRVGDICGEGNELLAARPVLMSNYLCYHVQSGPALFQGLKAKTPRKSSCAGSVPAARASSTDGTWQGCQHDQELMDLCESY